MLFMNRWEIEDAVNRYANHKVLARATRFLYEFMEQTNEVSDGWHSWPKPARAAAKLMKLIQSGCNQYSRNSNRYVD